MLIPVDVEARAGISAGVLAFVATESLAHSSVFTVSHISQHRGSLLVIGIERELSNVQALHDHLTVVMVSARFLPPAVFALPPPAAANIAWIPFFLEDNGVAVVDDETDFRAEEATLSLALGLDFFFSPPPKKL